MNLLCHELRVQQQRKKGALDYDRINSFMNKAGKARGEYEKLEAVVKVVYPEVIPEVEELDQMKNPDLQTRARRTSLRMLYWMVSFRDEGCSFDVIYILYI